MSRVSRALRWTAGWSMAVTAALLLNLALVAQMAAPDSRTVSGADADPAPTAAAAVAPVAEAAVRIPPWITWPLGTGELAPLDGPTSRALQVAVDRARREYELATLAVGVMVARQRGWAGASGLAADGRTALDGDSAFGIASITKTFTASIVLQLVEERRLSLGDRVAELLPDVKVPEDVTVRMLLNHTSGLADLLAPMREPMTADRARHWTGAEVLARIGDPWYEPGAGYAYSNTNYVLLGLIVERVTGNPFSVELRDRLLEPLGLEETGVLAEDGAPPLMPDSWASAFGTSGNMYSSASDLLRWAAALYHGNVLRPSTRSRMLAVGEDGYGLGVQRIELGSRVGYGHSGLLQGFTSLLVDLPADDVTLVVIGTHSEFEPAEVFTRSEKGQPSILDLALAAR